MKKLLPVILAITATAILSLYMAACTYIPEVEGIYYLSSHTTERGLPNARENVLTYTYDNSPTVIEFKKNGTVTVLRGPAGSGEWSLNGNTISMTLDEVETTCTISVDDKLLEFTTDVDNPDYYIRITVIYTKVTE